MGHKAAKKARKLLNTLQAQTGDKDSWTEHVYVENENRRKKQLVELKTGEEKEITVSLGQLTLKPGSGRAVYKVIKRAMQGKASGVNSKPLTNFPVATAGLPVQQKLLPVAEPTFIETEE
jgi:hypothetical protein